MTVLTLPEFKDKAILVTGASTGIGAAVAKAFGAQGAWVGVHYNSSRAEAESVAAAIAAAGGKAHLVKADASSPSALTQAVEETAEAFGRLDGLINNAGAMVARQAYADYTDAHYDAVMDLNGRSVLVASKAAFPHIKAAGGGFIINTSSVAARNGASGGAGLYGSSKAFVSNVTRGMAKEFIAEGIRVNAVAPGVIETPFQDRYSTPQILEGQRQAIPQQRLGTAEDCVGAYLFLASKSSAGYIIGQTIEVNGGMLMP